MKPLSSIAMGLVIIVLVARFGAYDALADPLGWLLVLWGVRRLSDPTTLLTLAGVALVVSCAVWLPATQESLEGIDPSLRWAINLPQVIFCVVLCRQLSALAAAAGDVRAANWQRTAMVLNALSAAVPVVAFAAGIDEELPAVYAGLVVLLLIILLFVHDRRPWAPTSSSGGIRLK